uniref:Uncharacterized protein n=1 Tax=Strongyloides papillosus TaxID=174720 RepID=A0A0N5BQV8_STREA
MFGEHQTIEDHRTIISSQIRVAEDIQMEEGDDDGDNAIEEIENNVQLDLVKKMMLPCLTEEDVLNKKFFLILKL